MLKMAIACSGSAMKGFEQWRKEVVGFGSARQVMWPKLLFRLVLGRAREKKGCGCMSSSWTSRSGTFQYSRRPVLVFGRRRMSVVRKRRLEYE